MGRLTSCSSSGSTYLLDGFCRKGSGPCKHGREDKSWGTELSVMEHPALSLPSMGMWYLSTCSSSATYGGRREGGGKEEGGRGGKERREEEEGGREEEEGEKEGQGRCNQYG